MKTTLICAALAVAAAVTATVMWMNVRSAPEPDWYVRGSMDSAWPAPTTAAPAPKPAPEVTIVRARVALRDAAAMDQRIREQAARWAAHPDTEVQTLSAQRPNYRVKTSSGEIAQQILELHAGKHQLTPGYRDWPRETLQQPDGEYEIVLHAKVIFPRQHLWGRALGATVVAWGLTGATVIAAREWQLAHDQRLMGQA